MAVRGPGTQKALTKACGCGLQSCTGPGREGGGVPEGLVLCDSPLLLTPAGLWPSLDAAGHGALTRSWHGRQAQSTLFFSVGQNPQAAAFTGTSRTRACSCPPAWHTGPLPPVRLWSGPSCMWSSQCPGRLRQESQVQARVGRSVDIWSGPGPGCPLLPSLLPQPAWRPSFLSFPEAAGGSGVEALWDWTQICPGLWAARVLLCGRQWDSVTWGGLEGTA